MIASYKKHLPKIHPKAFVAPNAVVVGRVTLGKGSSVWFGAVLRGDINRIQIGNRSNIQDNSVLHVESDRPCIIGDEVIVGHQATIHACRIDSHALIGIGARILNGAVIGEHAIVGAGTLILEGARVPPSTLVVGIPGKVVRRITREEQMSHHQAALKYEALSQVYREEMQLSDQTHAIFSSTVKMRQ